MESNGCAWANHLHLITLVDLSMESDQTLFARMGGRPAIDGLVIDFYRRAHQHPILGPVFTAHVTDWPSHLATVADFWSTQTGGPRLYRGGMGRHIRLGLRPEHFLEWLTLWESTVRSRFPEEIALDLMVIAKVIAGRLQEMVDGVEQLRVG